MRIDHLSLTDFRNYRDASLDLHEGPQLFVGPNGQGKTNLVEAVSYLSSLSSHRTSLDHALIRDRHDSAVIRARISHGDRSRLLEVQLNRTSANRAQLNRGKITFRDVRTYFSSVLFAPEDLALVRGDPSTRRRFLDQLLVERAPRFAGVLSDYDRVLRQRNSLLKSARAARVKRDELTTLDIWDERLVAIGSEIIDARLALVDVLCSPLRDAYASLVGADHKPVITSVMSITNPAVVEDMDHEATTTLAVSDSPSETEEVFRESLRSVRSKERDRGISLVGPHRDDLFIGLNDLPAKGYASHGESWSLALALRLASAQVMRDESNSGDPVLILDDVFAELDSVRRRRLAAAVRDYEQVLITCAVDDDVPVELAARVVRIEKGTILS